jgi:hypothetical protein
MPNLPEIWMQGRVSGQGSTVEASVNGRRSIPMNRREDLFGYLLPLDFGTNVVVLVAADAGKTNIASRVLLIERSDRYRCLYVPQTCRHGGTQSLVVAQHLRRRDTFGAQHRLRASHHSGTPMTTADKLCRVVGSSRDACTIPNSRDTSDFVSILL